MSEKHQIWCDKCKKELMKNENYANREDRHMLNISNPAYGAHHGKILAEFDLCKSCANQIIKILEENLGGK